MPQRYRLCLSPVVPVGVELQADRLLHAGSVDVRLRTALHLPTLAQHQVAAALHVSNPASMLRCKDDWLILCPTATELHA